MEEAPVLKDLVLVGGGHSHVVVLRMFGMRPVPGVRVTLVAKDVLTPYSGMLPGLIAGHYTHGDAHIDLRRLCGWAGARLVHAEATGIDATARRVGLAGRPPLRYDVLSIDTGLEPDAAGVPGAAEHALKARRWCLLTARCVPLPMGLGRVKPIARFHARWESLLSSIRASPPASPPLTLAVVGGGPGGLELACALRTRLNTELTALGRPHSAACVMLLTRGPLAHGHPAGRGLATLLQPLLAERGVCLKESPTGVTRVAPTPGGGVTLSFHEGSPPLEAIAAVWCTHGRGPDWLRDSGLALDASGFLRVNAGLESVSHGGVFAAGDVATVGPHPRPKAGVFAVRQGPPLAANLARALRGQPPRPFVPQAVFLSLLSLGDRQAVGTYGRWAFQIPGLGALGRRLLWAWKDRIDRRFMARFAPHDPRSAFPGLPNRGAMTSSVPAIPRGPTQRMRCGGCGCKVGPAALGDALGRLRAGGYVGAVRPEVSLGLGVSMTESVNESVNESVTEGADDAALLSLPPGTLTAQTVDAFRSFTPHFDPYLLGRISATHALGDLWAMGATPVAALLLASLPPGPPGIVSESLFQLAAGAAAALADAGCALAGGHSAEGPLGLGVAATGSLGLGKLPSLKGGGGRAVAGMAVVLTKPLGTGVIMAADATGDAPAAAVASALESMTLGAGGAAGILRAAGAVAVTDVTGFGLLGHGLDMAVSLSHHKLGIEVDAAAAPALLGAAELLAGGHASSLAPANGAPLRPGGGVANGAAILAEAEAVAVGRGGVRRTWWGGVIARVVRFLLGPFSQAAWGTPDRPLHHHPDFDPDPLPQLPPRLALLVDPQTAGGLLAALPAAAAPAALAALAVAGHPHAAVVGRVVCLEGVGGGGGLCVEAPLRIVGLGGAWGELGGRRDRRAL